jgi:hypothetical protein
VVDVTLLWYADELGVPTKRSGRVDVALAKMAGNVVDLAQARDEIVVMSLLMQSLTSYVGVNGIAAAASMSIVATSAIFSAY